MLCSEAASPETPPHHLWPTPLPYCLFVPPLPLGLDQEGLVAQSLVQGVREGWKEGWETKT